MISKKKQIAVIAIASVMSITSMLTPVTIAHAADMQSNIRQIQTESENNTPPIILPEHLTGNVGQPLQSIALPDGWSWVDGSTIISKEKTEYLARIAVDDNTYDYTAVKGYSAEEHTVEKTISVTVLMPEPNTALSSKAQIPSPQVNSISTLGDVDINPTDFPDEKFREYLLNAYSKGGNKIAVADVTIIDIRDRTDITDLKGIEKFTDLTILCCFNTGIQSLDVSKNTALTKLYCYDTEIQALDVSKNTKLDTLYCYNTEIQALDVRKNSKLLWLDCHNTEIHALDVSKNTALTDLVCYDTGIQALDVSKNIALTDLVCFNTGIQVLDVRKNTALTNLLCFNTGIRNLDVSNNIALTELSCYHTEIKTLDISKNINLKSLTFDGRGITSLDVSKNTNLKSLFCSDNEITSLDVSKNTALTDLLCYNTKIQFLDVSNSPDLKFLDTQQTNLAYLDWGTADLTDLYMDSSTIELTVTDNAFDITKAFPGIDISKVTVTHGGRLDGNDITGYTIGTPITYTYDCGLFKGTLVKLNVTLNLSKSDSKIEITGNPDMTYTGNPVAAPSVKREGSTGAVTYTYEFWNGNTWSVFNGIPTNVGKYQVTAHLAEDDFYNGAETSSTFVIVPKNVENNNQIFISDVKSDKDVKNLIVKDVNEELKKGKDYNVDRKQSGNKVTVTITFKGNYTGTITRSYIVENKKPSNSTIQDKNGSAQTGDTVTSGLWTMLMTLSAGMIAFVKSRKHKESAK
ncbi:hypothetical protein DWW36_07730 [Erysipelotrichaceae bacterium AF15-26LB]|nr:hypothetical protein DWW36_07730 [Erysipelotrichaceae bacterium AF15-26LB]RJV90654.1 hypothetical protein DWX45_07920 [Erysipelotrichaceae bacterium AF19-24AC]